jgi:sugar/nucleoside kinase (ribokinase family)
METSKRRSEPHLMPPKPQVVGVGLITLDMVLSMDSAGIQMFAGGTCGNVLAILSSLGWVATPVARIGDDIAGNSVKDDFARWGVNLSCLSLRPTTRTPVIVEKNSKGSEWYSVSYLLVSLPRL